MAGQARKNERKSMAIATALLTSISPLSQSQGLKSEPKKNEPWDTYEKRVWRERVQTDNKNNVIIPSMAIKNCLSSAARYIGMSVPGAKGKTFTKLFESAVYVLDPVVTNVTLEQVTSEAIFVPSDGKRGGGSRVWKTFPLIRSWQGHVKVNVLDARISEDVFYRHLNDAGSFIGVGRFRPEKNGFYGRFSVSQFEWHELDF